MTANDEFELLLDEFFGEGPTEVADWVIDTSLTDIETTPQRRVGFDPRRFFPMRTPARIAVGAAALVAVALVAVLIFPRGQANVAGPPDSSAPPASAAPPAAQAACTTDLPQPGTILGDCSYSISPLAVPATIHGRPHWILNASAPNTLTFYATMDNEPSNVTALVMTMTILDHTLSQPCHAPDSSAGASIPYTGTTPEAFWSWLHQHAPMLTFETPVPVTIGGVHGLQAVNATPAGRISAACQGNSVVDVGDLGGQSTHWIGEGAGTGRTTALVADGKTILIDVFVGTGDGPSDQTDVTFFPTFAQEADALLGTLRFATGPGASAAAASSKP
jgi:hypothetical protein